MLSRFYLGIVLKKVVCLFVAVLVSKCFKAYFFVLSEYLWHVGLNSSESKLSFETKKTNKQTHTKLAFT